MDVTIDGVRYVPAIEGSADVTLLDFVFPSQDHGTLSIREYLHKLLDTLWAEGESFKGRYPFGNSGWEYELYYALARALAIPGEPQLVEGDNPDEYCHWTLSEDAKKDADVIVFSLIAQMCGVVNVGQ
jgi:hypothetical protein